MWNPEGGGGKDERSMAAVKFEAILKGDPGDFLEAARALDAEEAANAEGSDVYKLFTAEGVAEALSVFKEEDLLTYLQKFPRKVVQELRSVVETAKQRSTLHAARAEAEQISERPMGGADYATRAKGKVDVAKKMLEVLDKALGEG
jgi:hypothetical protein